MNTHSLHVLAQQLAAQLDCTQDATCRQIIQAMAESGQPLAPASLAARLQMSQENLTAHLASVPDTEFDVQGNIVGWGITLLPTQHRFRLKEHPLFTWCAFDTVLFPPLLHVEAHIQSICEASGQSITFLATPNGIVDLHPASSVLSLVVPDARCDCVRGTFCHQSLFFQTAAAASPWLIHHPEAILLSITDAAALGAIVAGM